MTGYFACANVRAYRCFECDAGCADGVVSWKMVCSSQSQQTLHFHARKKSKKNEMRDGPDVCARFPAPPRIPSSRRAIRTGPATTPCCERAYRSTAPVFDACAFKQPLPFITDKNKKRTSKIKAYGISRIVRFRIGIKHVHSNCSSEGRSSPSPTATLTPRLFLSA